MSYRILKLGDRLIGVLAGDTTDTDLAAFQTDLAERVGEHRPGSVIVDVAEVSVIDSFTARSLSQLGTTIKLRGARTVVVGIQPVLAYAMARLGLSLPGIPTALDLDAGLELLDEPARV